MEDRKRRRIIETAIALAEKDGFDAVRLRDVATRAKVALGTVYRRFRSKEDILVAALEHQHGQLIEQLAEHPIHGGDPAYRVTTYLNALTQQFVSKPNLARALLRAVSSGVPAKSDKILAYHESMIQLIIQAIRGGNVPPEPPIAREWEVAFHLQNTWFALMIGWSSKLYDLDQVEHHINDATTMLLQYALSSER